MLFHSASFLAFLGVFLSGLLFFHGRSRVIYVIVASYVFYGWWYPPYVLLLGGLTLLAHYGPMFAGSSRRRLAVLVAVTLLPLITYKYTGFIIENLGYLFSWSLQRPGWQLPIGISFITFTVIAYQFDVFRGRVELESRVERTALFVSFFPHLIAGPILRYRELRLQLGRIQIRTAQLKYALLLFAVGALKKVAVADQLAPVIDRIWTSDAPLTFADSAMAFYGFTVQIYCDFSGYTDMALALAAFIGVRLPRNFDRPYMALSIREFWRRWHMTLSRWLRDYLYIPLGGNRHGTSRMVLAIILTMGLGGLWHGAAWTFVIWGLYHGVLIVFEAMMRRSPLSRHWSRVPSFLRRFLVVHVVAISWILFRAQDLRAASKILDGFFVPGESDMQLAALAWPAMLVAAFFLLHRFDHLAYIRLIAKRSLASVVVPLTAMIIMVSVALSIGNPNAFIYFDF